MTKQPKQEHYQDGDIFIFIGAVILFFAFLIILYPHVTDAAENEKIVVHWADERIIFVEYANLDDEKALDAFKNNPKILCTIKELTLQDYIWQFLTDEMELSDECAAGIFGNMMVECGGRSFNLQPYIYSSGGYYYGLCQWSTSNHHAGINGGSVEQQLNYLASTIRDEMDEYGYSAFEGSTDPESAAYYFARFYERCSVPTGRREEARIAYERFTES